MIDARDDHGDDNPSGKRSVFQGPGCNDNDDPNRDNTLSIAVPDRPTPNGSVTGISRHRIERLAM
jgi:hypothetical protein